MREKILEKISWALGYPKYVSIQDKILCFTNIVELLTWLKSFQSYLHYSVIQSYIFTWSSHNFGKQVLFETQKQGLSDNFSKSHLQ